MLTADDFKPKRTLISTRLKDNSKTEKTCLQLKSNRHGQSSYIKTLEKPRIIHPNRKYSKNGTVISCRHSTVDKFNTSSLTTNLISSFNNKPIINTSPVDQSDKSIKYRCFYAIRSSDGQSHINTLKK